MHMTTNPYIISEADRSILLALNRFHYLTAAQLSRLLYPKLKDENRYAQRRLKQLAAAEYALQLRALPKPQYGQAPYVYTLGRKGRMYVQGLGVSVDPYFRPSEERRTTMNSPFMAHRLATIDVMIAADRLCRDVPGITCPRMLSERELKRGAIRVAVPPLEHSTADGPRKIAVIPDAWFQLSFNGSDPVSLAIELDRGTEDQKVWREKVAAYTVWAGGPYQEVFETDDLTIAVACPDEGRRMVLLDWTMRELKARGAGEYADLFLFTATSPVEASPSRFFFGKVWRQAGSPKAISLIEPPGAQTAGEGVVYSIV